MTKKNAAYLFICVSVQQRPIAVSVSVMIDDWSTKLISAVRARSVLWNAYDEDWERERTGTVWTVEKFVLFIAVNEFWKSGKNWQSYSHAFDVLYF